MCLVGDRALCSRSRTRISTTVFRTDRTSYRTAPCSTPTRPGPTSSRATAPPLPAESRGSTGRRRTEEPPHRWSWSGTTSWGTKCQTLRSVQGSERALGVCSTQRMTTLDHQRNSREHHDRGAHFGVVESAGSWTCCVLVNKSKRISNLGDRHCAHRRSEPVDPDCRRLHVRAWSPPNSSYQKRAFSI